MKAVSSIFAALLLAGCITSEAPQAPPQHVAIPLSPQQMNLVQAGVRANLAEPAAATFGPIYAGQHDANTIGVCGFVNGRNRMGGMSGLLPFYGAIVGSAPNQTYRHSATAAGEDVAVAMIQVCRRAGIMPAS